MKRKSIIDSFNFAVSGIIIALKTEKNMKIHYIIALGVIILSLFFDFSRVEFLLLLFSITLVVVAEMVNTALERVIDLITQDYHPLARLVKDVAAGAVLIAAINSIIVGYLLFFDRLSEYTNLLLFKIRGSSVHLTFVALLIVILLTIGLKAKFYRGRGTHFQGGTVSGHSAVSFCVATIIAFLAQNMLVTTLTFSLAILVGESRIEGKIHSLMEVIFGGILGILVGVLVFQIIG
ncbi:diacylglycerol kinase [Tissierella pigra]|uniref:Phosphatase PAP2 family protein n=1 Tax=Tissierella pigra TaxID=2607614 RepID=A0A6N7XZ37_9FIRM|nr:diacylglycerol kinase [Tissierella pigra]MBU5427104.1 diacylglycerol kinase [Tissierella pigra]MSU01745.1 phosphatase PAP2 family protein [Tissierella pigra]